MTSSEQEYLKQIYLFTSVRGTVIHTKKLAELVNVSPASVSDIIKRLAKKKMLIYTRYHGCRLSRSGEKEALQIIRRHRLWELFLSEKLDIDWKEIHPMATYLQGLQSNVLIEKLSVFLGHPLSDPHGEPIPDKNGKFQNTDSLEILDLKINQPATISGFRESSREFLEYMEKLDLLIGTEMQVISLLSYDRSIEILIESKARRIISKETAQKIYVRVITKLIK